VHVRSEMSSSPLHSIPLIEHIMRDPVVVHNIRRRVIELAFVPHLPTNVNFSFYAGDYP